MLDCARETLQNVERINGRNSSTPTSVVTGQTFNTGSRSYYLELSIRVKNTTKNEDLLELETVLNSDHNDKDL